MYSTCLFCQHDLGRNESIEHFPVGRRLAFDAAKGRLWVVCRKCERWNLTPLEERWEAIEEAERFFRDTKLRVSTDNIGLARLRGGLELVRIGAPQRPEMAAWRYGDQFGRRRTKHLVMVGVGVAAAGALMIGGPVLGLATGGLGGQAFNMVNILRSAYRSRKFVQFQLDDGTYAKARLTDMPRIQLELVDGEVQLLVPDPKSSNMGNREFWKFSEQHTRRFTGPEAMRAASIILPYVNVGGGSKADVGRAVDSLESAGGTEMIFKRAAAILRDTDDSGKLIRRTRVAHALQRLPAPTRLALEMAVHEESERRALDGELHLLEAEWRNAEEIAKIADDMFLPADIDAQVECLRHHEG